MAGWLSEIESWVKVAGAAVAVVMAVLVPVRSWVAESRRAGTPEVGRAGGQGSGETLAITELAASLREVAAALRMLAATGETARLLRIARTLDALRDDLAADPDG